MFLNCSTCCERHTAHHQELKNCNCSLWFYIRLWLPAAVRTEWALSHDNCRQPQTYVKPEAGITVFELLMMGGVSLETCWAIKKHWNNKFYYTVASCWLFLWDLYYDARIHEHHDVYYDARIHERQIYIIVATKIQFNYLLSLCWHSSHKDNHRDSQRQQNFLSTLQKEVRKCKQINYKF